MSTWTEKKKDDLIFDEKENELGIYIDSDSFGADYIFIKVEILLDYLKDNKVI